MMWQLTPTDPPCEQGLTAVGAGVGSDFPLSRICVVREGVVYTLTKENTQLVNKTTKK
jgi:hypothetical protein